MTPTTASKPRSAAARKAAANAGAGDAAPAAVDTGVEVEIPGTGPELADIRTAEIEVEHDEEAPQGAAPPLVEGGKVTVRLRHKRGCPKDPARIEKIAARTPKGADVVVVRCCDCGESDVAGDRRYEDDEL